MHNKDETALHRAGPADPDLIARRRARISQLIGHKAGGAGLAAASGLEDLLRRKLVAWADATLAGTAAESAEPIQGTPYNRAGLERLLTALKTRAQSADTAAGKAARAFLRFISAAPDEAQVDGISVAKLQRLASAARRGGPN